MCAKRSIHKSGNVIATNQTMRPIRDLLLQLPHLTVTSEFEIDYAAANPALLLQLASSGDIAMRTIHQGLAAVGLLIAHSAPEMETREISGDAIEAIGWLIGELGEFAGVVHSIVAACRRSIVDYVPGTVECVPNAKP